MGLERLGICLDKEKNKQGANGAVTEIQTANSAIKILIIPTDEELEIAQQTSAVVNSRA
jgi:acetate kinase